LVFAHDVNLLGGGGGSLDTKQKNAETLLDARKEVGLEINAEETKYELLSHHQYAEQNQGPSDIWE
jgi:hypothetical protein